MAYTDYYALSSGIFVCLVGFLVLKLATGYRRFRKWASEYDKLPGPEKRFPYGTTHLYPGPNEAGLAYQTMLVGKYPKFYCIWESSFLPVIICHHPDILRLLLPASDVQKARGVGTAYECGIKWLGEGLIVANGKRWFRNRRLLTPAFHFDILQPYMKVYNSTVDILLNRIEELSNSGESIELFSAIGRCSLDIILQCAFSYKTDCQKSGEHPYLKAVFELDHLWVKRLLNPLHYPDFIYFNWTSDGKKFLKNCDYVHKIAEGIIEDRRRTLANMELEDQSNRTSQRHLDFLDVLLTARDEDGQALSTLEIRNEVDTFLFAGHDTTTSSMCWTLYALAQHPDIQEHVYREVDDILSGKETDNIEWKDLQKLEYLTLCIKEAMRLHSPVHFVQRITTERLEVDGYIIPAHTRVGIGLYNLHHNPALWDKPFEYQPQRFTKENSADRDAFAYIPFSAGPRNCIGQNFALNEQKVLLARLVHRYIFQLDRNTKVVKKQGVVMHAENGIKVFAIPRQC